MADSTTIEILLSIQDELADVVEQRAVLNAVAVELDQRSAEVSKVTIAAAQASGMIAKGDEKSGNLLDIKINLDTLKNFGKWLYERLVGTSTKAKFEYEGAKFEFDGRNPQDLAVAMENWEKYVVTIEKAKQAKNG
jgi:hypothetical protein